ncbi:acyl-CoA dehydrogenase [Tumebacillus avium]|uniref:Acyl-CoA dehydrogenase n=1 Tax=Tumebacillus avium TaxID=1903704 RepID=A0A1Y0IIF8_9BACL|nr:acyl-CoA dehydrogenase family protein [Tumebacillus avium]ARU60248.1 acyl-CoA dehydrogenase [Tumebacillus avium]
MKTQLTDLQQSLKNEFRAFADEFVAPYAAYNDREERLHETIIPNMIERGYLGSMLPAEHGGLGYDNVTIGALNEELGRVCVSARVLLTVHGMVALALLRWGSREQKETLLPKIAKGEVIGAFALSEPETGSDAKSVKTTAVLDGDEYVLNGRKKWISMGMRADLFLVIAGLDGKPTAFLVEGDRAGFSRTHMKGLMGSRGSEIAELTFEDVRIPKANLVGREGMGLTGVALSCLDYGRYTVAWGCIGLAQACFEASASYAKNRHQFGAPIGENQLIQKMITEMVTQITAARLLCYHAGYLKDIGDPDSIMETWNAKYLSSVMVSKIAADAVQIHGGNGVHPDYPVERYYRDAKINEIIEGSTQIHEFLIAKNVLRTF